MALTVSDAAKKCDLDILCGADISRELCGVYAGDLLSWVMGHAQYGQALVTIMSNNNVLAVASLLELSCVILAEGVVPDEAFLDIAKEKGINVLSGKKSTYDICTSIFTASGK